MKMIIDIPDKYKDNYKTVYNGSKKADEILNAIKNGTVLPKGHGALKDVTNLMRGLYEEMQTDLKSILIYTPSDVYSMIDEECPTIIEAESEE